MKINNVKTQYEIPGFDIAPQAFEPGEEDDFEAAPYSRDPGLISPPPTGGWQHLFGLMQVSPTPTSIAPPTRNLTGRLRLDNTASHSVIRNSAHRDDLQPVIFSPKVTKMITMLASRQEAIDKIRIRASEVGQ